METIDRTAIAQGRQLALVKQHWSDQLICPLMFVLAVGIFIIASEDFMPGLFLSLANLAAPFTQRIFPTLSPHGALAQICFVLGSFGLIFPPAYRGAVVFVVLQINAAFSSMLPALQLGLPAELAVRLLTTYASLIALIMLGQLQKSTLWKMFWPPYLVSSFLGNNGPNPLAAIGTELLVWGYTFMGVLGVKPLVAWCFVCAGGIFLARFAYLGMLERVPLARQWFVLNIIFALGSGVKVLHLL